MGGKKKRNLDNKNKFLITVCEVAQKTCVLTVHNSLTLKWKDINQVLNLKCWYLPAGLQDITSKQTVTSSHFPCKKPMLWYLSAVCSEILLCDATDH